MPKRRKPKSAAQLKKKLWTVFSRYIRLRDAIKTTGDVDVVSCVTCHAVKDIKSCDAGHFFSRTHTSIMFDEKNVHAQCKKCNMPPNPGEQYLYSKQIVVMYGEDELKRLEQERFNVKKYSTKELEQMILDYKEKVAGLTKEHGSPWE